MNRVLVCIFVFFATLTFSQQLPQFTQFSTNVSLINNANFINESDGINIGARSQMLGFGLEPNSAFVFGNYGLKKKPQPNYNPQIRISKPIPQSVIKPSRIEHAIAAIALIDRYGAFNRTHLSAIYNLGYQINPNWSLSGSIKFGVSSLGFNSEDAVVLNSNDPFSSYIGGDLEYDEYINGNSRAINIDLGSALFINSKSFKVGVSFDQLAGNALSFSNSSVNFNQKIHYTILMGYTYHFENNLRMELIGMMKQMSPAPPTFDLTARANYLNKFWGGLNYRHSSAIGILAGMQLGKGLKLGYSYDIITNRLNLFSSGGHELILGYAF